MFTFRLASAARIAVAGVFIGVAGVPLVSACGSAPPATTAATTSLTKVVATQSVPSADRPGTRFMTAWQTSDQSIVVTAARS